RRTDKPSTASIDTAPQTITLPLRLGPMPDEHRMNFAWILARVLRWSSISKWPDRDCVSGNDRAPAFMAPISGRAFVCQVLFGFQRSLGATGSGWGFFAR